MSKYRKGNIVRVYTFNEEYPSWDIEMNRTLGRSFVIDYCTTEHNVIIYGLVNTDWVFRESWLKFASEPLAIGEYFYRLGKIYRINAVENNVVVGFYELQQNS